MKTPIYMSVTEFSKITGISQSTIRDYCNKGIITSYRPGGWKRLIPVEEALEQLKTNRAHWTKPPKPRIVQHHGSDLRVVPTYKRARKEST